MKVLVTGAAGFIGSNLVGRLLRDGHEVIGIDNLSHGTKMNLLSALDHPSFEFYQLDITRDNLPMVSLANCAIIVHLAALKIPRFNDALETLQVNVHGTEAMAELARLTGAKLIFASTSDVYGMQSVIPFAEMSSMVIGRPQVRRWAYAISKMFAEQLLFAYSERYGNKVTLLRFFGGYGPNQDMTWRGGPQAVFIEAALDGKPFDIHGDGLQTRTFTYVTDFIEAIVRCFDLDHSRTVLNIGSTREISILDLAQKIWQLTGCRDEICVRFLPYETFGAYEDVRRRVPDISLAQQLIEFEPAIDLDAGLAATIMWQRERRRILETQYSASQIRL